MNSYLPWLAALSCSRNDAWLPARAPARAPSGVAEAWRAPHVAQNASPGRMALLQLPQLKRSAVGTLAVANVRREAPVSESRGRTLVPHQLQKASSIKTPRRHEGQLPVRSIPIAIPMQPEARRFGATRLVTELRWCLDRKNMRAGVRLPALRGDEGASTALLVQEPGSGRVAVVGGL